MSIYDQGDTIAAVATAPGQGGIAIVRLSGEGAEPILKQMFIPAKRREYFESHRLMYGHAVDAEGHALDEVMAALMRAPSTYTREDVAEIYCHGGAASADAVTACSASLAAVTARSSIFPVDTAPAASSAPVTARAERLLSPGA